MRDKILRVCSILLILVLLCGAGCGNSRGLYSGIAHSDLANLWGADHDTQNATVGSSVLTTDVQINEILGTTDFSEMVYEHFDPTAVLAAVESLTADLEGDCEASEILSGFADVMDELSILSCSYTMANLYNSLDASDQYYMDELTYVTEQYDIVRDRICILGQKILNSELGEEARAEWNPLDVEYFEEYIALTEEQIALNKKEQELVNAYNAAAIKEYETTIRGKQYALEDLADAYYDGHINYREYYQGYDDCMNKMEEALGPIYVEMVLLRQQIAKSYGYDHYSDYAYEILYDRDYTPDDAQAFCDEVKEYLVPAFSDYSEVSDSENRDRLDRKATEYDSEEQLILVKKYLNRVDPELLANFNYMQEYHLYDIDADEKKSDGGYTTFIEVYNQPFFFNYPTNSFYDIMTIVHEFGHFNSFCINAEEVAHVQNLDLAEIASQGLELLYTEFYGEMLGEEYEETAEQYTLYQRISSVIEGCLYDEFQREVYSMDNPTLSDINLCFAEVASRYYPEYYEAGVEENWWMMVPHNFESPLYYISYAVSVVPALEIWEIAQTDFDGAKETYMKVVRAGESDGYKETLKEIGLATPFEAGTVKKIAGMIQ